MLLTEREKGKEVPELTALLRGILNDFIADFLRQGAAESQKHENENAPASSVRREHHYLLLWNDSREIYPSDLIKGSRCMRQPERHSMLMVESNKVDAGVYK